MTLQQISMFPDLVKPVARRKVAKPRVTVARFLALGAGVQSSAVAEMIVEGVLDPVDAVIFADTGNEPPWVYEQVKYLNDRLGTIGVPLHVVQKDGLGIVEEAYQGLGGFASMPLFTSDNSGKASMLRRQCTNEFKVRPMNDFVLDWMTEHKFAKRITDKNGRDSRRVSQKVKVEYWFGISLDEFERSGRRGPHWQLAKYPLIDKRITRVGCEQWLKDHNLPVPWKSSCIICPFHDNAFWKWLKSTWLKLFELACQFDDWLRTPDGRKRLRLRDDCYLHRSCVPLRNVDFDQRTPLDHLICGDHCMT